MPDERIGESNASKDHRATYWREERRQRFRPRFSKHANNATVAAPFFCGTVLSKSVARGRDAQSWDSLEPDFVESAVVG
jgi:hypothetical protein